MNCSLVPFFPPLFGGNTKVIYSAFNSPSERNALHHEDCTARRTPLVIAPSLEMTKHIRGRINTNKREGINK